MNINFPEDSTAISEEDKDSLLLKNITTINELNSVEATTILEARISIFSRRRVNWLSQTFFKTTHKKMFNKVWKWAGKYRKTNTNIGVEWYSISIEMENLIQDTKIWISTKMDEKEMLARFHHRLVKIHPFPNGNGRHSRLLTDFFSFNEKLKVKPIWVKPSQLQTQSDMRSRYISALKSADNNSIEPLIEFMFFGK